MGWSCFSSCRRQRAQEDAGDTNHVTDLQSVPSTTTSSFRRLELSVSSLVSKGRCDAKYERLERLGEGKTGRVFRVRARQTPRYEAAAKVIRREYLSTANRQAALKQELSIVQRARHPNLLRVFDVFDEPEQVVIVTERALGGEVLDVLCSSPSWTEMDVMFIVRELLTVLAFLHSHGITHRDVKPENVLCRTTSLRDGIVLIDFGLAHKGRVGAATMTGMNGTCHFMAPEMFGKESRYGSAVDVWALGVVAFVLLFGRYPFDARFMSQVEDKIVAGHYEFPSEMLHEVSPEAIKFIEALLTPLVSLLSYNARKDIREAVDASFKAAKETKSAAEVAKCVEALQKAPLLSLLSYNARKELREAVDASFKAAKETKSAAEVAKCVEALQKAVHAKLKEAFKADAPPSSLSLDDHSVAHAKDIVEKMRDRVQREPFLSHVSENGRLQLQQLAHDTLIKLDRSKSPPPLQC
ncbi:hypothetical protein P43SY_005724 [Pythium insidiosum]|uniref:Protein kinase domain-containing protein n=1 Tax=Pythium insidiosum TaxID=114742 RepID=A0AAD5LR01_PYTIN|nr:hypothetical protein P43SY_005724 [Pythium insidiosum]